MAGQGAFIEIIFTIGISLAIHKNFGSQKSVAIVHTYMYFNNDTVFFSVALFLGLCQSWFRSRRSNSLPDYVNVKGGVPRETRME